MHRHATYEAPLCAEDPHIMLFWAAMHELPTKNVQALLKQLMPPTTSPARVHQVLYGAKHAPSSPPAPFCLHILPPTAVAMLSPDVSEIVLFADRSALALPRYSSLKVMMDYLHHVSTV
uniref:Uncharacterized protein n=1 Tax=Spumella elongata TaxID=89044 RepID=A0A7S3HT54_9STRA